MGEPFLLVLGDEIFNTDISCPKMLVQKYNDLKTPIIAVKEVEKNKVKNYGIIEGKKYIEKTEDMNFTEVLHNLKELKFALLVNEKRFDCGSKSGLVKANIAMTLKNQQIANEIKEYIKKKVK